MSISFMTKALEGSSAITEPLAIPMEVSTTTTPKKHLGDIIIDGHELNDMKIKHPPPIIYPILLEGSLMLIFAKRGVGKTWAVSQLAISVATGSPFWGHLAHKKNVLLIDGEMSLSDTQQRLSMLSPGKIPKNIKILSSERVSLENQTININDQACQKEISEIVAELEIGLVIFDNLSSLCFGRDENSNSDLDILLPWLISLRHQGVAVVIVHHAGKDGKLRGASRIEDPLDTVMQLSAPKDTPDGVAFKMTYTKIRREKPTPYTQNLTLQKIGDKYEWSTDSLNIKPSVAQLVLKAIIEITPKTQTQICQYLGKDKSQVSTAIKSLRSNNLVKPKSLTITKDGMDHMSTYLLGIKPVSDVDDYEDTL
jgi:hypothetical protein